MSYEKTQGILNQLVADLSQFSTVIHQAHWYMRGAEFLNLHPKMDEYMDGINEQLDEVAERLITIGGAPYSTLKEFADNTKIEDKPASYDTPMTERLETLVAGYRYLVSVYAAGIDVAGEEGDNVTEDLFIDFKGQTEKIIWMLTATLGQKPGI
ncbi:Dps family protein [Vagococcus intermedius]|uniref:DNA starvation/stationary phase protection protein n=1 Tax=Vagococcus intermedius TaxID=2991418 RepID=A0AAF0CVQ7_9ENTE|nr:DNA starvation/stationary phase protection protein [Vagococcus intermedius]WEG73751.1 DNA starvation/stationary phase protection protein [Vagococcus intermedius]WEG75836.1 DNA starvation/stationary phase protection protein [Vagococcus intermedius]